MERFVLPCLIMIGIQYLNSYLRLSYNHELIRTKRIKQQENNRNDFLPKSQAYKSNIETVKKKFSERLHGQDPHPHVQMGANLAIYLWNTLTNFRRDAIQSSPVDDDHICCSFLHHFSVLETNSIFLLIKQKGLMFLFIHLHFQTIQNGVQWYISNI